ncbi:3',5'-cyclic-AMP phosphodiesterase [Kovacikia minuta CCNUW1]|uniref:3',5'-cyclic-AMP phosphodiesterase n=1 Tax=Kovacikia minuta TaxID=2931930 RepID=UPI001CCC199E|nr:3',5'-cyclic-AMP phosphodiesterase [Kovacikia minuta]UBF23971.1 3',5'-cyclic-AMP phosphodiesterase [Kovacikia minuta CCNUW1]
MSVLSPLRVVQITDVHLFADSDQLLLGLPTTESFEVVLRQVATLDPAPDLIVLTGDLSQDGKPESYKLLRSLLKPLGIPVYWLPGNHDYLPAMEPILDGSVISSQKSFCVRGWCFLLLNSQVPGHVHGCLKQESLKWLDHQLTAMRDYPTLVGLHHPPFLVGSNWLDGSTLQNSSDLFSVLDRHPQVRLVVFGHIHQEYSHQRQGVQYLGTPSTCIQFEPHSSDFALDQERPGFRLLHLYPDGTWWTAVERTNYVHELDLVTRGY